MHASLLPGRKAFRNLSACNCMLDGNEESNTRLGGLFCQPHRTVLFLPILKGCSVFCQIKVRKGKEEGAWCTAEAAEAAKSAAKWEAGKLSQKQQEAMRVVKEAIADSAGVSAAVAAATQARPSPPSLFPCNSSPHVGVSRWQPHRGAHSREEHEPWKNMQEPKKIHLTHVNRSRPPAPGDPACRPTCPPTPTG